MSERDEQVKNLEEEVVVNEVSTELVEVEESKKAKAVRLAKKGLKYAGIAAVGVVGFILGTKAGRKSNCDDSEEVIYEVEQSDEE